MKKQTTAQAKGRMAVSQREGQKANERMQNALQMSRYNSSKYKDKDGKFKNPESQTIAPAQYGNLRVKSSKQKALNAAYGMGKKPAKKGK